MIRTLEDADRVGVILAGRAQVQKVFPNGSQVHVAVRMPEDLIGPVAAFSSVGKFPWDIVALDELSVLFFDKNDLLRLLGLNAAFIRNFINQIATAAFTLQQKIELFSYHGIAQKIAFTLLMHRHQSGREFYPIPVSITKWALSMNVSRPSLHRELKKLESQGILQITPRGVRILRADALQTILEQQRTR